MLLKYPARNVHPAEARKLVEESVAYARSLGLLPHVDYQKAAVLFGDVTASESDAEFEFGKDGKPFFIPGPSDTPQRCRRIMATLEASCGSDGYDFLIVDEHIRKYGTQWLRDSDATKELSEADEDE